MNTAACLTRLTMIVATLAAAVTVQAAPVAPATQVVTLPTVTVIGKREPVMQVAQAAVVTLPTVTVIGKRVSSSMPTVVAQKALSASPLKAAAPV
jgi:hypothetical protein